MKKFKLFLGSTILGVVLSSTGCGIVNGTSSIESQQNEIESMMEEKENLSREIESMIEEKESLNYEIENREQRIKELEEEKEKLASENESLEEVHENLSTEIDNRQQELDNFNEEEHDIKNLYFLDTSLIDPTCDPLYYILEKDDDLYTPFGCESKQCIYRELDYNDSGKNPICYAEVFKSIGLKNNIDFYLEAHWPNNLYEEKVYFSIVSYPTYYRYTINTNPGSIDNDPRNKQLYNDFHSIFVPLESVLKDEETKPTYTTQEIIDMMNKMNSLEYDLEEEKLLNRSSY